MRKLSVSLMILILLLSSLPALPTSAEIACDTEGFCFEDLVDENGKLLGVKLRSYTGASNEPIIPSNYNGKVVIEIGEEAFLKKQIDTVVIPDSVEKIGAKAFYFSRLKSVTLPKQLKVVESQAFSGNELISIMLPEGTERLEDFAFSYNELTFVELPKSLEFIGTNAFYENELIGVKINSDLTYNSVESASIFSVNPLRYIEFGEGVTNFSQDFLKNLSNLPYESRGRWYVDAELKTPFTDMVTPELKRIYADSYNVEYGVFYDANGATSGTPPEVSFVLGARELEVQSPLTTLTKPGAKFLGWNTKADGSGEFYRAGDLLTMPFHHVELFAYWGEVEQAVVTTHLAKGPQHMVVKIGDKLTLNNPSVPYDQHFVGWFKDQDLTKPLSIDSDQVEGNLNLYPKFEQNQYTVQFETNGGTAVSNLQLYREALFNLEDVTTSREGYQLEGWYYDRALTEKADAEQVVLGNKTYYAKWQQNEYQTIYFETNGGSPVEPYEAVKGTSLDYTQFVSKKEGTEFIGWYVDQELEKPLNMDNNFVNSDMTLYAKWSATQQFAVNFQVDGGQPIESVKLQFGEALGEAPIAVKSGYAFEGWYYDSQLTLPYNERDAVFSNMTLYVKWRELDRIMGYINGFPDGTFKPDAAVTREQMALMIANILTNYNVPKSDAAPFTDTAKSYAKDAIHYVNNMGLMTGKTAATFDPQGNMTRAEMATVVTRYEQKRCAEAPNENCVTNSAVFYFNDVVQSFWANVSIQYVANMGAMRGYVDGSFKPKNNITRAETVKVLNQVFNRPELPNDVIPRQFVDTSNHWARTEIEKAATTYTIK